MKDQNTYSDSPAVSYALQKYMAFKTQAEATANTPSDPFPQPIPKSFGSYEVSGGVVRKVEQ